MALEDADYYRTQAIRCRRLASASDKREAKMLRDTAEEYDRKARELGNPNP